MAYADAMWPSLPLEEWRDTYQTLHLWTQVVGKVRLALAHPLNHWWQATLYVNSRGLTTSLIPHPSGSFEIQFDFLAHRLEIQTVAGQRREFPLRARSVAEFYFELMEALRSLGIEVSIQTRPQEGAGSVPFEQATSPGSYDPAYVGRFFRILVSTHDVLQEFRSSFIGKCSPVHFFWGSFDLACTRFSGRPAPPRKGVITGPAYSHEVISAGFWPGAGFTGPAYYAYAAPSPPLLEAEPVRPAGAAWNKQLSEFILMYDAVRAADSPRRALMEFLESSYSAAARLANWDRAALETTWPIPATT
jgi:hypothetical protein